MEKATYYTRDKASIMSPFKSTFSYITSWFTIFSISWAPQNTSGATSHNKTSAEPKSVNDKALSARDIEQIIDENLAGKILKNPKSKTLYLSYDLLSDQQLKTLVGKLSDSQKHLMAEYNIPIDVVLQGPKQANDIYLSSIVGASNYTKPSIESLYKDITDSQNKQVLENPKNRIPYCSANNVTDKELKNLLKKLSPGQKHLLADHKLPIDIVKNVDHLFANKIFCEHLIGNKQYVDQAVNSIYDNLDKYIVH